MAPAAVALAPFRPHLAKNIKVLRPLSCYNSAMPKTTAPVLSTREAKITLTLHAAPAQAWRALTRDIGQWWPAAFHTSEHTRRFVLEAKLGGMMGELGAKGDGLVWYRVIGLERGRSVTLAGHLLPPWGGPANSLVRITLTPVKPRETQLEFIDHTFGVVDSGETEAGWRQLLTEHLQPFAERRAGRR